MNIWWARRTTTGGAYVLFLILVTGAAVNTGNNTLYITAATMMGILLVSGFLSLLAITTARLGPLKYTELFAEETGTIFVRVENRRRWFPLQGLLINGQPVDPIPSRGESWAPVSVTFSERGSVSSLELTVTSTYPFGFFLRERKIRMESPITVYPHPIPVSQCDALLWKGTGEQVSEAHLMGERYYRGLKPFHPGEDPRTIHWKKTAQQQRFIAKEYSFLQSGRAIYILPVEGGREEFERSVCRVTYCILRNLRRGRAVGIQYREDSIEPGTGLVHRQRILTFLALVQP
ncbi:MAG TPA: DUF58 domain-containing protein [Thermoanaerobaculia bacterium]|nr:DUF58 domain-containing protein [Thermoanaerobaculia bacterium]HUM29284.1 DUF58 domain-containing protein [Thermoanaerobaculia bacterium]HXK67758.1 DUF58 domain-containing protein [Thermoanaerobaculia bacterium]